MTLINYRFLFLLLICYTNYSLAQKESHRWVFGELAGIDFNFTPPQPTLYNLTTQEGTASIADSNGNLLFYTNGITVWNKDNNIMLNGDSLLGHSSSTQSAVIVPWPGSDSLYHIFAVSAEGGIPIVLGGNGFGGMTHSIVDISGDMGQGEVTNKNDTLLELSTEKITAVLHENQKDIWVIAHGWLSDTFYVYKVTEQGLNKTPLKTSIGLTHDGATQNTRGYLKVAPNGDKLALAIHGSGSIELFDFDTETGTISNPLSFPGAISGAYGIEFSTNSSKLYVSNLNDIFQLNLALDSASMIDSIKTIATTVGTGALQLGPDRRIYATNHTVDALHIINNPNGLGNACNFQNNGLSIAPGKGRLGLPNFIQSYFTPPTILISNLCSNQNIKFTISDTIGIDSVYWDFGDTTNSIEVYPIHFYDKADTYTVSVDVFYSNSQEEHAIRTIIIDTPPSLSVTSDTSVCKGQNITLEMTTDASKFVWSTGDSTLQTSVNDSGDYIATVMNGNCIIRDTTHVSLLAILLNVGFDTTICQEDSITLYGDTTNPSVLYEWSTGSTSSQIIVTPGVYILNSTLNSCLQTDSFIINSSLTHKPNIKDTIICKGLMYFVELSGYTKYAWSTGGANSTVTLSTTGLYSVLVHDSMGCLSSDSFLLETETCLNTNSLPNSFTPNQDNLNDFFLPEEVKIGKLNLDEFYIFNRWGELVFECKDNFSCNQGWNGVHQGEICPIGAYLYEYSGHSLSGEYFIQSGSFMLIR